MNKLQTWLPWGVVGVAMLYLGVMTVPFGDGAHPYHFREFGRLPVQEGGRIQPFDTFARIKLMQISHRMTATHGTFKQDPDNANQEIVEDRIRIPPAKWALDTMLSTFVQDSEALKYRVFRIDNVDLVNFLGLKHRPGSWRYSFNEFSEHEGFWQQVERLREQDGPRKDDIFENKIAELFGQFKAFVMVQKLQIRLVPPGERQAVGDTDWLTPTDAVAEVKQGIDHKPLDYCMDMLRAYSLDNPKDFNATLAEYQRYLLRHHAQDYHSARLEAFFQRFEPFYHSALLYGLVFVLGCLSWLGTSWDRPLRNSAFALALLILAVHSWALIVRITLTGRPPVTNLYSSAIFIGWGCVGLCLILEWLYKNSIGVVVAALTGMLTLIIAHNLVTGDTMEMLQAVLDTNFWLATHVICITCGYTATFVAGFLGIKYVLLGVFTPKLRGTFGGELTKMIYGVMCFAVLLSFVGTVLGGIWADESWGRFWGWDPKENGALMIVIWTALVLHARWGGIVKARGMANLAIFGNCVVAWSWFGTNMLGVGLHSYGFMKGAMIWMLVFVISQLVLIGIGCLPLRMWKSFMPTQPPRETPPGKASVAIST